MTDTTETLLVVSPTKFVFPVGFAVLGVASALRQMPSAALVCLTAFLLASFHFLRPVILSVRSGEQYLDADLLERGAADPVRPHQRDDVQAVPVDARWQRRAVVMTLKHGQRLPVSGASGAAYYRVKPLDLPPPGRPSTISTLSNERGSGHHPESDVGGD